MKKISSIAAAIKPSATMAIDTEVRRLRSMGIDVSAFGGGEPDFVADDAVLAAGIHAIESGATKYTPAVGTPELRRAVANRINEDCGTSYTDAQVVITAGGKFAIYAAMRVLLDPGDEVILPSPYWVSYYEQIRMMGAVPVVIRGSADNDFKVTAEQLNDAITDKTKLLILNNPGNPCGNVYSRNELCAIAEVCCEKDIYVLSDEMYSKLIYDGAEFTCFAALSEDAAARTVLINGASKAYAMTGWRIGYAAAPEHIAKAMAAYLSQSTGCPSSVSQAAALAAFSGSQLHVEKMRSAYEERRNYLVSRIQAIDSLSCEMPKGAFYLMINVEKLYGRTLGGRLIENDMDFAQALLDSARVAVTPGIAFDAPGYVRWCYAASLDELKIGLDRLENFIEE